MSFGVEKLKYWKNSEGFIHSHLLACHKLIRMIRDIYIYIYYNIYIIIHLILKYIYNRIVPQNCMSLGLLEYIYIYIYYISSACPQVHMNAIVAIVTHPSHGP